ncbi:MULTISPECIES: hypothetical protein [unclassified Nodularia (in: cyanobacteria)]|uniref:hypothetical protein n=1 Tax=unclassified Nodularia (in: cyanobacteria) TaxID=2656917 RepID=UPI001881A895|nr:MULTISPECIES: hypothetical protein [unclassified Nodularia (in: cyanobacteria)]MBE9199837.1 hypothetical protein [Nodularia sp. LEGE 06071]MCC2692758.1 hypothetical protein [Nodularia sp. LEGE 04288]
MVERPIKKSERQAQAITDNNSESSDSLPPVESQSKSVKPVVNRSSSTGKKSSFKDDIRQKVSPALARGPKPVKVPVNVKTEPESESEPISDEPQE